MVSRSRPQTHSRSTEMSSCKGWTRVPRAQLPPRSLRVSAHRSFLFLKPPASCLSLPGSLESIGISPLSKCQDACQNAQLSDCSYVHMCSCSQDGLGRSRNMPLPSLSFSVSLLPSLHPEPQSCQSGPKFWGVAATIN